jgi:N-acetylglucosamine kinase-like BadF-type ATPase
VFLGVDGGGTTTDFCLVTHDGDLAAAVVAPSCYYLGSDVGLVGRVLAQGVTAVCDQADITPGDIEQAFFGLPGYGEVGADVAALDAAPGAVLGHGRYTCDNDMVCGWAGSLGAADGINVISGTGSMAYGERGGAQARVGGWGEAFGDEGSGHWIAVRGLQAFSQMSDGRLPTGLLLDTLRQHLQLRHDLDLIDIVLHRWHRQRQQVAKLARIVVGAAQAGDVACLGILADAGRELALLAVAARHRLHFEDQVLVPVSYSGGVFTASEVLTPFARRLTEARENYELRLPLYAPAVGAALYAAKRAGTPLNADALRHLAKSLAVAPWSGSGL